MKHNRNTTHNNFKTTKNFITSSQFVLVFLSHRKLLASLKNPHPSTYKTIPRKRFSHIALNLVVIYI